MNRAMEGMGGKIVRRYRIYEQALGSGADEAQAWDTIGGLAE
jgi:hypothetical protein